MKPHIYIPIILISTMIFFGLYFESKEQNIKAQEICKPYAVENYYIYNNRMKVICL
jgi:hypothetical protein